jgi:transposase
MNTYFLPDSLTVTATQTSADQLILTVRDTRPQVCCPVCGQPSGRIHSHYLRVTQDAAMSDHAVEVRLQVRRLRCTTPSCPRQTFAEAWPGWLDARVQRTTRLAQLQRSVALALGGEAGRRLLDLLHDDTSADTLLRLIRSQLIPEQPPPRVLGVDDFCFRRGKTYGTLLIDLERHRVVDVLPDRLAATLATWLNAHPGIDIISRDRYGDYARGAATGAPKAQQIADRFHLLKNLRDTSELWLRHHRAHLVSPTPAVVVHDGAALVPAPPGHPSPSADRTVQRLNAVLEKRAQRRGRYERAMALHAEGYTARAIGTLTGTSRTVISGWIKAGQFPGRASVLPAIAPYVETVRARALTSEWTGKQIFDEVVTQGYTGSHNGVYELLRWMRLGHLLPSVEDHQAQETTSPGLTRKPYSAKQGAWMFIQPAAELNARDQERLALLHTAVDASQTVYGLVQDFAHLLRTQPQDAAERLKTWLVAAKSSAVLELERFANGIQKDVAAVLGAMTSPWSNGQTEGQVTRVKLLKRQMYGRAKFDLLRARILLA